ncbi:glycyl radical protein [Chloroflexota bacterium]
MVTATVIDKVNIDEVNKVNVLTDRVRRLKQRCEEAVPHICCERSRLVTESWRETEGEPLDIRRAKLFRRVLQGISIVIRDGELIVGSQTKYVRGASPAVDFNSKIGSEALLAEMITAGGLAEVAEITDEEKQSILEDCLYWSGHSPSEAIRKATETRFPKTTEWIKCGLVPGFGGAPPAAKALDYAKAINRGLEGTISDAREQLNNLEYTDHPAEDYNKECFLQAVIIACEGAIEFAHRYARLAEEMAEKEKDPGRKKELEKIAEICQWVPAKPARSYYEALQSFWFTHICHNLEAAWLSEAPGRMDQYLYPFYEKDIKEGKMTRQEAAELLGCLWVKFDGMISVKASHDKENVPTTQLQDITICGVTSDGKDASNELSYMLLEVLAQMKTPQPSIYLRYHHQINPEIWMKAAEVNVRNGAGNPAFVNDGVGVLSFTRHGVPLRDAREWSVRGCAAGGIGHLTTGGHGVGYMNVAKVFELVLNNGCDPASGKQLGLATGDPRTFTSIEQVVAAFKQQFGYILSEQAKAFRLGWYVRSANYSLPFQSAFLGDCIIKGMDAYKGGVRYPQLLSTCNNRGGQNVADSLAAIKKLVFEEKKISMDELLQAISANFEGKEDVRRMLLSAPKYGNDDDYVDDIFNDLSLWLQDRVGKEKNQFGTKLLAQGTGAVIHVIFGKRVGALPDGRKAGEPIADGYLSPGQGRDTKGPTAVINSASKVNHMENSKSALMNMKFDRKTLDSREKLQKFLSLIKTFFDRGGFHIQFNISDRETLLEAKRHPEQYRNLMVRVAGFSAYFVDLAPELQDEIISRTEYDGI